ncbi:MAG: hypothetical protein ACYS8Z_21770, partial [Planctomycetota bacterium]
MKERISSLLIIVIGVAIGVYAIHEIVCSEPEDNRKRELCAKMDGIVAMAQELADANAVIHINPNEPNDIKYGADAFFDLNDQYDVILDVNYFLPTNVVFC